MRRVLVLGSTGSIGVQALEVIAANPGRFELVGLSAGSNGDKLAAQAAAAGVTRTALGVDQSVALIHETVPDVVLNGITGSVGLAPTLAALEVGSTLALANKESLIVGGELVTRAAKPGQIVPVDSEHSALAQALRSGDKGEVRRLVLTASGGPFRGRSRDSLAGVTPADALAHPTWDMGLVVTTNSATLVNKGLEVIEAHLLFDVPYDRIDVTVHPQSVVHSMVEFCDGSVLAQLGATDMRLPIQYAFSYPERWPTPVPPLDMTRSGVLEFGPPDLDRFPCLRLAYRALEHGGGWPVVLNAANEVAVHAFLEGRLPFTGISRVIDDTLAKADHTISAPGTLADVRKADDWARKVCLETIGTLRSS
jgi:1-deoxy-D-xylulose-5-phosphate reductoisomerase